MVDKNVEREPEEVDSEIKLNELLVGKRILRFIYLYYPDVVSTVWDESREGTPLFLGSDVLAECSISRGNFPRVHAKHAKRGLATKVNFPARTKVLGIHGTARGVWFYSIQGTFKVAFDYYTREDQDGCLKELEKVWRTHILDPILKNEVHVVMRKEPEIPHELPSEAVMDVVDETDHKVIDENQIVEQINKAINTFVLEANNQTQQRELGLLKTYISFLNLGNNTNCFLTRTVNLLKNCLALIPAISESYNFSEKEAILSEIAGWLGTEFAGYHGYVSERVTAFKQKHIRSIENLPSAENLVGEVFPASMDILFRRWLELPPAENQSPTNEGSRNSMTLFPVVQIILELANRNLVSGVAHVLYSRLILSDSV